MKNYCFDTSGISNPVENLPDDIYMPIWLGVIGVIEAGAIAVTTEIYDEMSGSIHGLVGDCIGSNKANMVLEIGGKDWDSATYVAAVSAMQQSQHAFISENIGGTKKTVSKNDISIIALGKALGLPVVSMEKPVSTYTTTKRKIPDVCRIEGVEHLDFNTFLRREGIGLT